jgi:hypothetical protein
MLVLATALSLIVVACASATTKPIRLYHPDTAPQYKLAIVKRVVRHAEHVHAFFETHPRLARSSAGRAALWRQGRLLKAALKAIRQVRRELWLNLPEANDWRLAATIAQRPYPGSFEFLMQTSSEEGGHGLWVRYGGDAYYAGYETTDAVGGWMQYRPSTFAGHWRHAREDLRRRGFRVPRSLRDATLVAAWRSPLAQALSAGWACWAGQTFSHWSASGNRC